MSVEKLETPNANMAATYQIKIGDKALSQQVDIPLCDQVLTKALLAFNDSNFNKSTGDVTGGTQASGEALWLVFKKPDSTFEAVTIDVKTILSEAEFKNGLVVSANGEVSIKLVTNDDYLKFGEVSTEGENATLEANVVTIADAAEGNTGLADAFDVKNEIDNVAVYWKTLD